MFYILSIVKKHELKGEAKMLFRYRIVKPFRFIVFVVLSLILLFSILNLIFGFSSAQSITVETYESVTIEQGDTLWEIAGEYMPEDTDIRFFIYRICQINDIKADDLYPGMTIKVPTGYSN